ncbi:MAG: DUF6468 domain-containing protein [Alphaproteobacteria bacterium]
MTVTLVLDGVIVVLLAATIAYCVILNRRLGELRGGHAEFIKLVESFNAATERAETSIAGLREASAEKGGILDQRIEAAQALCDDLSFLVERGERVADRLASGSGGGTAPPPESLSHGPRPFAGAAIPGEESAIERDLRDALRVARQG